MLVAGAEDAQRVHRAAQRRLLREGYSDFIGFRGLLFNRGNSPESIQAEYPLLKPAQIYGAIAFYLDHKADIDEYLTQSEREFERSAIPMEQADPALWQKLQRPRARLGESRT